MPPKSKISKEDIVSAGVDLVRRSGEKGLNARNLAAALGCSTQPIFTNFPSMEELRKSVICKASELITPALSGSARRQIIRRIRRWAWAI